MMPPSNSSAHQSKTSVLPIVTLALWRVRQTWGLLLLTVIGIISAVMFACSVPLYSNVAMSAGLRGAINTAPQNADIYVQGSSDQVSKSVISTLSTRIDAMFQRRFGAYIGAQQLSVLTSEFTVLQKNAAIMRFVGDSMSKASSYVQLVQGRLPRTTGSVIETAITPETARYLHVSVGSVLSIEADFYTNTISTVQQTSRTLKVPIVGIINLNEDDYFWHQNTFQPIPKPHGPTTYSGLASNDALLSVFAGFNDDPADQGALNLIAGDPLRVALGLRWYALGTVLVAVLAMIIAVARTMHLDVLSIRREAARSMQHPFWQRLNLDVVATIIMLTGFGYTAYITHSDAIDVQVRLLLVSPLTLLGTVFLTIAAMLLFLRFFPFLLQWGSRLATLGRGAAAGLALAQMARSPRQSLRMTFILSLATAFAIFTLIFAATQAQRIFDVANHQSGADFSGTIASQVHIVPLPVSPAEVKQRTMDYRHIAGVLSATVGYAGQVTAGKNMKGAYGAYAKLMVKTHLAFQAKVPIPWQVI